MVEQPVSVSNRLITKVAEVSDTDPTDLPCLYDRVDPDALNDLIHEMTEGAVYLEYAGYQVVIDSSATIDVARQPTASDLSGGAAGERIE